MQSFTAKQYLKIDIANAFGLDKLDWDERLKWFDANEPHLLNKLSEAETPAMFYAGVKAWEDVKAGRATGYPISLDATASGIQILSVLTGDRSAALLSNVVDAGKRVDAYSKLFEGMKERVGENTHISRSDLKAAIMPAFYGSEAKPREIFGEGKLLQAFYETMEKETPYVWELNKAFLDMWDPKALKHAWVLPDNFHVHVKVMGQVEETVKFLGEAFTTTHEENIPVAQGRSLGANITHSVDGFIVRELMRRCSYETEQKAYIQSLIIEGPGGVRDETSERSQMVMRLWDLYQQSGYLSSRILDFLDSSNIHLVSTDDLQDLLDSMPEKPFRILAIHDCFRVHPNYGNVLREQYNLQLALIAKSNMLQFLLSQVLNQNVTIYKQADLFDEVLNANYALS